LNKKGSGSIPERGSNFLPMKTLLIYNQIDTELQYALLDGDYSRFHGVIVNATVGNGFEEEFVDFFFNKENGDTNFPLSNDVKLIENKGWDKVAIATWLP
jgi:hypothetical protein